MATQQQIKDITGLYVAYFDRAPDPAGLQFWIDQLDNGRDFSTISQDFAESTEAKEIYPFLATPDLVSNSPTAFIVSIYANLFGRAPDEAGLNFWAGVLASGSVAPGDMVEAIMLGAQDTLVNGQLIEDKTTIENKIDCALEFTNNVVNIEGFKFDAEAYAAARQAIDGVNATDASVDAAKLLTQQYINEFATVSNFALQQAQMEVEIPDSATSTDVMVDTLMWGNPASGEGIPISEFFGVGGYFSMIASQQFAGVAEIEVDEDMFSIIDFSAVESITINPTAVDGSSSTTSGGVLSFNYTDGSSDDIALGEAYYGLLSELMFVYDDSGDTRFFTQSAPAQIPVYVDADGNATVVASEGVGAPIGYVDASIVGENDTMMVDVPLILTTTANNGSTTFPGFTSADNDVIVAGTLDLLHGAYIDGGLGQNTLEVDAKGYFAQPKALLNIQTINVQNLPNIYTDDANSSTYPDITGEGSSDSILDLSRATALENLVVTEGSYDYLDTPGSAGDLLLVGVRNDATVTLSGGFNNDVYITTTGGYPADGFTVVLNNVLAHDGGADLYIADNASKLNLISEGGGSNLNGIYGYNDNRVTDLVISGSASLFIEDGLDSLMESETPLTIDASANLGGVDLNIDGGEFITFIGSQGNDRFSVDANDESGTIQGPDFGDDEAVVITNTVGNNWYDVDSKELTLTDGDGNNTLKFEGGGATASFGDGDNTIAMEVYELNLTVGDGDNFIDIDTNAEDFSYINREEFDENVVIVAGNGENKISVDVSNDFDYAPTVNITAGDGGNDIEVMTGSTAENDVTITTGSGADKILAEGSAITIMSGGGNDDITIVGTDNDFAVDEVDIETGSTLDPNGNDVNSVNFFGGVLLNIDTGAGAAKITFGTEGESGNIASNNVIAKEGSVITGEDITLVVNTYTNLIAADLSGVTSVVMDDDAGNRADSDQANDLYDGERAQLTVTMDQFLAIGADNMSVDGAIFNTHAFVKIIVTESTSLTALGVDDLPRNIDLYLEVADGATLTMTAEQLHTRVARDGVTLSEDGNTDLANGHVVITGGGINFDPFNSNDTIQTDINGQVYYGGSISTADFGGAGGSNVTVQSVLRGYNRPADAQTVTVLTIDGDVTPTVDGFDSFHSNVEIVGSDDITFNGPIQLGLVQGESTNLFTIDFSELEGVASGLTIGNFETVEAVYGNGNAGYATEVFVEISGDGQDGGSVGIGFDNDNSSSDDDADDRALVSQGVSKYTVTVIDGPTAPGSTGSDATIRLCDKTEDLEVLALRGNYNDTLIIEDAAWGLTFELQGGGTRKAEGPTGFSNVGTLDADFEWDGAPAVVNIIHSVAGDTRPIYVEGIDIENAASITINADGPATTIENFDGNGAETLTFNADGDLSLVDTDTDGSAGSVINVDSDEPMTIDASGVVGVFTATLDGDDDGDFIFTGAQGGSDLTLIDVDDDAAEGVVIDGGAAGVALTISGDVDLDESTLTNVTSVLIEDGGTLRIQMTDADAIGAGNFSADDGVTANLELVGLGEEPFALANYDEDITVSVVSIVNDPVVTLNAATDLTGIGSLEVPEGTILNMTALQFQQLDGNGTITGDGTVNITDLDQAAVDYVDPTDSTPGLNLDGVTAETGTITMIGDVEMTTYTAPLSGDDDSFGTFEVVIGDGMTLTLDDVEQANGLVIGGGTNTTLKFLDTFVPFNGAGSSIDASGFNVDELVISNSLVADRNVDQLFFGLPEAVTKVIYTGIDFVDGVTQNVIIEEGTTVPGFLAFVKPEADVELRILNLTLEGGTEIDGDLILSGSSNEIGRVQADLQEVNIVSTGTAANFVNGETANVITGDITSQVFRGFTFFTNTPDGDDYVAVLNDLLNVNITGDQDFVLEGGIVFESVTADDQPGVLDDGITANDDEEATATLNVNSTADVTIGDLDTGDEDVDFLVVNNEGTGNLTVGISSLSTVDADDVITLNGSATGIDTVVVTGGRDFSGDTIEADWDFIQFNNGEPSGPGVLITVTQQQFIDITPAGFLANGDDTAMNNSATLDIVDFDGSVPFDATGLDADIDVGTITMAPGVQTLDPTTNLTGVDKIEVPEGGELTLTAAQYQQLGGSTGLKICVVDGSDANGDIDAPITVNITGLTQAIIDDGSFDLSMILTDAANDAPTDPIGNVTVTLAESVELSDDDIVQTSDVPGTGTLSNVEFILADGQDLGIENWDQADGLEITGTGTTDVFLRFDDENGIAPVQGNAISALSRLDVSGYSVSQLHALNTFVGGFNIEALLDELDSAVELVIYYDPEDLGFLNPTNRVVILEPGVTVMDTQSTVGPDAAFGFADPDSDDEVLSITIVARGGTNTDGDILFPALASTDLDKLFLQSFTFISEGDGVTENALSGGTANVINGDISPNGLGPVFVENNLLLVNLEATQALDINGTIFFNGVENEDDDEANLNVSGTAPITIDQLDVESSEGTNGEITTFSINNNGTSTLTITGSSNSIELSGSVENLFFAGTGDIVLDTTMSTAQGDSGVSGPGLSNMDASGLTGNLTLGVVEDVDNDDFSFTSGTGVTTMTMAYDDLADGATVDDTGWSFDFSNAAAGSELTLGLDTANAAPSRLTFADDSDLSIDMGPDGVLCINQDVNFSEVNLDITSAQPIVIKDGATVTMTAAQANGLTFVGENGAASTGVIHITGLGDDPIDLSGISADVAGYVFLEDDDVTLDPATDLGPQTIGLEARDRFDLSLEGQTIRFSTEEQASGQPIDVIREVNFAVNGNVTVVEWDDSTNPGTNVDDNNAINSTNVVFLFDSVTAPLDTFGFYDPSIGRVWFSADLLNSLNGDVENLFDSLANSILRIDFNTVQELDIQFSSAEVDRIIELTSFTNINGITEIDDGFPPEEHIETLTIFAGGEVTAGDVVIGDVVSDPDIDPSTPEFTSLVFNSMAALYTDHFLATEDYVNDNDGTDEVGETDEPENFNQFGDILVGAASDPGIELLNVTINTLGLYDNAFGIGDPGFPQNVRDFGADFEFGTLTFSGVDPSSTATLTITGENDVTGKAIDASGFPIVNVSVTTIGYTGTFLLTGGSPAFIGGDDNGDGNTEVLSFDNSGDSDGEIWFGHVFDENFDADPLTPGIEGGYVINTDGVDPYAGIDASTLSVIETFDHGGYINLGVVADIDSEDFRISNDNANGNGEGADGAGVGTVDLCLGEALDANGVLVSPALSATGRWEFDNGTGSTGVMNLEVKDVTFNTGGQLELDGVDVTITGDVDLSPLDPADISLSNTTITVAAGGKLTLSVELATILEDAGFIISGEGTVCVVGESDDTDIFVTDATFSNLQTATVDLSLVTLAATDSDQQLNITASGALDGSTQITQTIIGSDNNDELTISSSADDSDDTTVDIITRLGADSGTIGIPSSTRTTNTPADGTEVDGDVIIVNSSPTLSVQYEVDAGYDRTTEISHFDVVKVSAGAEFYAQHVDVGPLDWTATAESSNDGIAVIEDSIAAATFDVSAAVGTVGWTLIGVGDAEGNGSTDAANDISGSSLADTIIDGTAEDADNSGEGDTFTGNGGADTFVFNIATSDPADFSVENTIREARDYEAIDVNYVDTTDNDATDQLTINLDLDGTNIDILINESLTPGVDFTSSSSIASAIVTRLNDTPGITAQLDLVADAGGTIVAAYGEGGQLLQFNSFAVSGTMDAIVVGDFVVDDRDDFGGHGDDSTDTLDDDIGEVSMDLTGSVTIGETYSMTILVGDGDSYTRSVTASTNDPQDVLNSLAIQFNAIGAEFDAYTDTVIPGGTVIPSTAVPAGQIRIVDQLAQDGGSNITVASATSAVTALSSSSILDGTETSLAEADADVIADFTTGEDSIDFDLLGAGTALNYNEGPEAASFLAAQTAANSLSNLGSGDTYYLTSTAADGGLLFYDANNDGEADGVLNLTGVDASSFTFSDIV